MKLESYVCKKHKKKKEYNAWHKKWVCGECQNEEYMKKHKGNTIIYKLKPMKRKII